MATNRFVCVAVGAGVHRSMGAHMSFVRSVSMDAWEAEHLAIMEVSGGNARAREFFSSHGLSDSDSIVSKYHSRAAELYRAHLRREATRSSGALARKDSGEHDSWVANGDEASATSDAQETPTGSSASASTSTASWSHKQPSSARRTSVARRGASSASSKGGSLGAKKLSSKVDDSVYEQPPVELAASSALQTDSDATAEAAGHQGEQNVESAASVQQESATQPHQPRRIGGHVAPPTSSRFSLGWGELGGEGDKEQSSQKSTSMSTVQGQRLAPQQKQQQQQQQEAGESYEARRKFGKVKSISSDSLFGGAEGGGAAAAGTAAGMSGSSSRSELGGRLSQFQNATAISSDEYFGREQSGGKRPTTDDPAEQFMEQAKEDFETVREMAYEASNALSEAFSSLMSELSGSSRR